MISDSLAIVSFLLRHWKVLAFLVIVLIGWSAIQSQGAPAGAGVVYSYDEMVGALEDAGVPPADAPVGAAIARAESGGRSDAVHLCPPNCIPGQAPEQSYGPWQINILAHPDISPDCAMELRCAARAAARISNYGRNWNAWSTYNSGAFGSYLVA